MRKKISLLLAALLLTLTVVSGCSITASKNPDKQFRTYTHDLFRQEVSANTISLHYTLENPSAFDIKNAPVTFGSCTTDAKALYASLENAQTVLHSFDRKKLNGKNRLTYDVLANYYSNTKEAAKYTLYEEPLAPMTGTQSQLPVLLSEYHLADANDIDTYLTLLTKFPEYFDSLIAFEKAKAKAGLFMAPYTADAIIKECNAFSSMGDHNYLFSSFEERLQKLNLSQEDYDSYVSQNATHINDYIFPSYKRLTDTLSALRTSGSNNNGLCYYPDGKAYYALLVKQETGSNRTVPELEELARRQMFDDLTVLQNTITSASSNTTSENAPILDDTDPLSILNELESKLDPHFPAPPDVDTKIKYVQESMQEYLSPAFYMVPAIDSTEQNVIYINQGHLMTDISLYTTLAHEGYPGHLYQTTYYQNQNPDPIRNLLSCGGYTEGWATYSEMISYYYSPLPKEQATLLQKNTSVLLGIYALADMGIHYEGWKLTDTVSFFRQYGITDVNTIENIYDLIIADPGNYLKYYIGYVEFLELKKEALEKWGEAFSQTAFHKSVLEAGPVPFDILRDYVLSKP